MDGHFMSILGLRLPKRPSFQCDDNQANTGRGICLADPLLAHQSAQPDGTRGAGVSVGGILPASWGGGHRRIFVLNSPSSALPNHNRHLWLLFGTKDFDWIHVHRAQRRNETRDYGDYCQQSSSGGKSHWVPRFQTKEQCSGSAAGEHSQCSSRNQADHQHRTGVAQHGSDDAATAGSERHANADLTASPGEEV
jgi:hypothetical protein